MAEMSIQTGGKEKVDWPRGNSLKMLESPPEIEVEMTEIWKPVAGWPNYEVNASGLVRNRGRGRLIAAFLNDCGYLKVSLWRDGKMSVRPVHALVCIAFHGPRPSPTHQVAHWDGNRKNCHHDNLRWATPKENSADAIRHGRLLGRHPRAKLTEDAVREIRASGATPGSPEAIALAAKYGVRRKAIMRVLQRKTWSTLQPTAEPGEPV